MIDPIKVKPSQTGQVERLISNLQMDGLAKLSPSKTQKEIGLVVVMQGIKIVPGQLFITALDPEKILLCLESLRVQLN